MSLDGLRLWIGEVERKLGMRTRVFLALAAIAIGGAAAGIYLALEAANESVSKDEIRALQETVSTGAGEAGTATEAATVAALKTEVEALRSELSELQSEGSASTPEGKGGAPGSTEKEPETPTGKPGAKGGKEG